MTNGLWHIWVNFQEAFNAFHNDLPAVKKYLKPIHVGALEQYEDKQINKDFRKLKEEAVKMVRVVAKLIIRGWDGGRIAEWRQIYQSWKKQLLKW